jgi:CheY-like chemotaxis protein
MTQPNTNMKKILVIEDEPILGNLCVRILKLNGYIADLAKNGRIAKEMIQNNDYDMCLTDIRTPEMDGMELYEYLQEDRPSLAKNVIFMTGDVMSKGVNTFIEKYKVRYILKPFTQGELVAVIKVLDK